MLSCALAIAVRMLRLPCSPSVVPSASCTGRRASLTKASPEWTGKVHRCRGFVQRRAKGFVPSLRGTGVERGQFAPGRRINCKARVGGAASGGSQGEEGSKGLWERLQGVPWDSSARSWNNFWNMKTAGTVVEADLDSGNMAATPIKTLGLKMPEDMEECKDRLDANLVFYRQNYILFGIVSGLISAAFTNVAVLVGSCALLLAAVCRSNNLLGVTQLWLEDNLPEGKNPLTWNESRVMGFDRVLASRALAFGGVLLMIGLGEAHMTLNIVVKSVWLTVFAALAHGCTRPLSLTSWGANVLQDIKDVKSRQDLQKKAGKAWDSLKKVVTAKAEDAKNTPDPFTIFNVRGTGAPPSDNEPPSGPAGGKPPPRPNPKKLPPSK